MLVVAYILLKTAIAREHEVAQEISRLKGVVEVKVVFGEYDVVVKVATRDVKELDEVVTSIRRIDGVAITSTLVTSE
ncbi:MAG: Lrp/AsnC family transcriptional regulator [Thermoprotei archaeon]|nr:MAG: Lrp/AsnC family transcriptional regulator [Thermoprotei archaeon]RLF22807.1 MAG: Lrp/AsnC family transcriptional regulator [Thermoprotei archaeon]